MKCHVIIFAAKLLLYCIFELQKPDLCVGVFLLFFYRVHSEQREIRNKKAFSELSQAIIKFSAACVAYPDP